MENHLFFCFCKYVFLLLLCYLWYPFFCFNLSKIIFFERVEKKTKQRKETNTTYPVPFFLFLSFVCLFVPRFSFCCFVYFVLLTIPNKCYWYYLDSSMVQLFLQLICTIGIYYVYTVVHHQ